MISCKACKEPIASLSCHVEHFNLKHKVGSRSLFTCGYDSCSVKLPNLVRYENHVKLFHLVSPSPSTSVDSDEISYKCAQPGCNYKCRSKSAIRGHRFWEHQGAKDAESDIENLTHAENGEAFGSAATAEGGDFITVHLNDDISILNSVPSVAPNIICDRDLNYDLYMKKFVHMGLMATYKLHVPDSTFGSIIDSYATLINGTTALTTSELLSKLESSGVNMDVAKPIVEETLSDCILNRLHSPTSGPLRSYYMRKQQYTSKQIFSSVSPLQKSLGLNQDNIECKYHYVPVKESIQWLMEDDSVYEQYLASRLRRPVLQPDLLTDIHDGSSIMAHSLFMEDPTALQIILYYDDVTLAKALGPASSNFKISHFAFTLGNLKPWHRTKVDPIQLVMLCREQDVSYFGLERVLKPLIEDLKSLEEDGLEIRGENVKASIAVILGDNLASHTIGGFLENFSFSLYFCRYCEESRADWLARWYTSCPDENLSDSEEESSSESVASNEDEDDPEAISAGSDLETESDHYSSDDDIPLAQLFPQPSIKRNVAPLRTEEAYNECIRQLENNPKGVKGIVGNSEFNKLKFFHCAGGMPGCLAHDYLEGVIAYDLLLILKSLRKKYKFSWDYLNRKLKSFPFQGAEKKDKPPGKYGKRRKKVKGNAVQNHVLLRFLPMVLGKKVKDKADPVWGMILKLIEIYSLVSSPTISRDSLDHIDSCILKYLHERSTLFSSVKLRPKHHFMEHAKLLILKFGPPARTSTLKFESKHKYYRKEFVKGNTINPTYSLAKAHQLMQGGLRIDKLFENGVVMTNCVPFGEITDVELVQYITSVLGREFASKLRFAHQVTFHNTDYEMNKILVCSTKRHPQIDLCRTILYASFSDVAYAIGRKCTGKLVSDMQFYELDDSQQDLTLINLNDLLDFTPYDTYDWEHSKVVVLKHLCLLRRHEEEEDDPLNRSGQDLIVEEIMSFCDKQVTTKETLKTILNNCGVKTFSDLEFIDLKDILQDYLTPVALGKLKKHLDAKEAHDESLNDSRSSSIAFNVNEVFGRAFMKKLEGNKRLDKADRLKVARDIGDEIFSVAKRRITEKQCKGVAKILLSKFPHSLKAAPHTNGVLDLGHQLYFHCNYKYKLEKKNNNNSTSNANTPRRLFSDRQCYGLDPERDLPPDYPEGETRDSTEEKRLQLVNMSASGIVNKMEMKNLMKLTYVAQRADINNKEMVSTFIQRWPFFGRYSVLEAHFFKLMNKDKENFYEHINELCPKLAKYFEAEGNKSRKGEAGKGALKIREIMTNYLKIKEPSNAEELLSIIQCALAKLNVPPSTLFLHFDETTSFDELQASTKLPKSGAPVVLVCGDDLLLNTTKCYVAVEQTCISQEALTPMKALFASFMCYFVFKICYATNAAPIMDFLQRAIFEIENEENEESSQVNRVERKKTNKGYAASPKAINRKYATMMREIEDYFVAWKL